mgnify:CR=1 FL=1
MDKILRSIRAKRVDEQGFTLIELMVVVLIIRSEEHTSELQSH